MDITDKDERFCKPHQLAKRVFRVRSALFKYDNEYGHFPSSTAEWAKCFSYVKGPNRGKAAFSNFIKDALAYLNWKGYNIDPIKGLGHTGLSSYWVEKYYGTCEE